MSATGTHQKRSAATSANIAPSTSTLSASGSRNAPERVVPWRRARQPSTPSVHARARTTRPVPATTTAGAGSARTAAGEHEQAADRDRVGRGRERRRAVAPSGVRGGGQRRRGHGVGASRSGPSGASRSTLGWSRPPQGLGHEHDAVDLGGFTVGAADAGAVHEDFDHGADNSSRLRAVMRVLELAAARPGARPPGLRSTCVVERRRRRCRPRASRRRSRTSRAGPASTKAQQLRRGRPRSHRGSRR